MRYVVKWIAGFCYVIFKDQRDAEECVRQLDGREWGRMSRRFRVRFAWDGDARVRQAARRRDAEPSTKLFVAGYDARTTKASDLEVLFEEFGRIRVSNDGLRQRVFRQRFFFLLVFCF